MTKEQLTTKLQGKVYCRDGAVFPVAARHAASLALTSDRGLSLKTATKHQHHGSLFLISLSLCVLGFLS